MVLKKMQVLKLSNQSITNIQLEKINKFYGYQNQSLGNKK